MVWVIVLVNILVAICILRQVLILRKEVEEVSILVLQLKLRTAYTEATQWMEVVEALEVVVRELRCCPRVILHYNWED